MKQFIPYDKLSKAEKRKRDAMRRKTWGDISPVTRKPKNPKAYERKKSRLWEEESCQAGIFNVILGVPPAAERESEL